ncbi:MAG: hypothetical protein L6Q84_31220 [Polyangiaceae bacterium]|nr:hypothetical protein [Polyangiaceae bacterium]
MNFKSFKLLVGFGLCAVAASSTPACGGDDDDGGGSGGSTGGKDAGNDATSGGGTAGSGGTGGTGGSGATGGSGGSGGSQTMTCKSETCESYSIAGQLSLGPCCAGAGKDICGVDVDSTVSGLIGIKPGCYELNQKGNADTSCPSLTLFGFTFSGCCNTAAKQCSYLLDVTGLKGPNMGCVDPAQIPTDGGATPKACTPGSGDGGSDAATDGSSDAAGDAPADTGAG